jgi:hypothetical protein
MFVHPELGYYDERVDLTEAKLYAASRLAFGRARGLPPVAYRSKVFAELEDEKIWSRGWIHVGGADQIPSGGDLLPYTVGHHGVHVQRGADGGLAGRFNKAQHGGCRAVPLQCQTGVKTRCSFTSCGHSRDRDVIPASELGADTPAMRQYLGEQVERLLGVRVGCLGPLAFVCLDRQGPALEEALAPLALRLRPALAQGLAGAGGFWSEQRANWKLVGRALLDGLAPPGADAPAPAAARRRAPKRSAQAQAAEGGLALRSVALGDTTSGTLPVLAGHDDTATRTATFLWSFPNLLVALLPDHLVAIGLQPTAFSATLCRVRLYVGADAGVRDAGDPAIAALLGHWRGSIARAAAEAEAAQGEAERWGTPSRPETVGRPRPVETSAAGWRFQRYLIDCLLAEHAYYWAGPLTDARVR